MSNSEQILFNHLALFAGDWTFEAAEAVYTGGQIESEHVLGLGAQLGAKSMVVAEEAADGARFRLLETIRQYAAEKLLTSVDEAALRRRHFAVPKGASEATRVLLRHALC